MDVGQVEPQLRRPLSGARRKRDLDGLPGVGQFMLRRVGEWNQFVEESVSDILGLALQKGGPDRREPVNEPVAYAVAISALLIAVFAAIHTARNQLFGNPLFYAISVLEIVLIVLLIGGCIALGKTSRDVDGGLFVSYLVTVVVMPPAAVLWGIAEKSRWGTGVVVVAMLSIAVLSFRLLGIWQGHNA